MNAILWGRDHPEMGAVEVAAPADDLALALTRGHHPKPYDYVDPNEDVVAVARDDHTTAILIADGHNGHEASHALIATLLERLGRPLPPTLDKRAAATMLREANQWVAAMRRDLPRPNRGTRTTVALALVANGAVTTAAVGDSAVVLVRGGRAEQLTRDRHRFLGQRLSLPEVGGAMDHRVTQLEPGDVLVAVTDGYTNFAPVAAIPRIIDGLSPSAAAKALIDTAGRGGAGDNVAVALLARP